ncbi:hypothetical protein BU17DRAFT_86764 [Hysterangium stoloniferum]|nr:hypothetical protein BU17DRAFT_86764 [Hysterangium stoloniferum]
MTAIGSLDEFMERIGGEIDVLIMDTTSETAEMIVMAKEHLETFGRDVSRLRGSQIKLDKPVDPYLVLLSLLDNAPGQLGARYMATTIVICSRGSCHSPTSLVRLSDYFLHYLLLAIKAGAATRLTNQKPARRRTNEGPEGYFRKWLLQRDGYRCILSEDNYETNSTIPIGSTESQTKLQAAHILKPTVVAGKINNTTAVLTWNIISLYAGWINTQSNMIAKINKLDNGIILSRDLCDKFEQFSWALKPVFNSGGIVPDTYEVDIIDNSQLSVDDLSKLTSRTITFVDHSAPPPPPVGIPSPSTIPPPPRLALPHPGFLAFHRALSHVLHTSGAGEAINVTFRRFKRAGIRIPSRRMYDVDSLSIILAFATSST